MRQIFNTLETTPDPSCPTKLAAKSRLCGVLAKMQENTPVREEAVKTARTEARTARTDRNTARTDRNTARDAALSLNPSIAPVYRTADTINTIQTQGQGSHKALKAYQAAFNPPILKSCLDALNIVITKTNELAVKEAALTKADGALVDAQASLEKNTKNIKDRTEAIATLDTSMVGLNCNAPACIPNTLTGNKKKSKKRRTK